MYLKFGFHIFSNNLFANIILIVQLTISVITMNITVGLYNYAYARFDVLENFADDSTAYLSGFIDLYNIYGSESLAEYKSSLSVSDDTTLEPVMYNYMTDEASYFTCCAYGSETSQVLRLSLSSGSWYSDCEKTDGCINAVVFGGSDYAVGEVYELSIDYYDYSTGTEAEKIFTFKVTGTVSEATGFVGSSTYAQYETVKTMFTTSYEDEYYDAVFIFDYNDEDISDYMYFSSNLFAYAQDSKDKFKSDLKKLSSMGFVSTIGEVLDNSKENLQEEMHSVFPIAVSLALVGVIGIICLVVLNTLKNRRNFSIYFITGMKWSDCIKICISHVLCIFIGSAFLIVAAFLIAHYADLFNYTHILMLANNALLTGGMFLLVLIISFITTKLMLYGTSPVAALKKD